MSTADTIQKLQAFAARFQNVRTFPDVARYTLFLTCPNCDACIVASHTRKLTDAAEATTCTHCDTTFMPAEKQIFAIRDCVSGNVVMHDRKTGTWTPFTKKSLLDLVNSMDDSIRAIDVSIQRGKELEDRLLGTLENLGTGSTVKTVH